jgi:hypothetical protein
MYPCSNSARTDKLIFGKTRNVLTNETVAEWWFMEIPLGSWVLKTCSLFI